MARAFPSENGHKTTLNDYFQQINIFLRSYYRLCIWIPTFHVAQCKAFLKSKSSTIWNLRLYSFSSLFISVSVSLAFFCFSSWIRYCAWSQYLFVKFERLNKNIENCFSQWNICCDVLPLSLSEYETIAYCFDCVHTFSFFNICSFRIIFIFYCESVVVFSFVHYLPSEC